jgi:hypothetical protein
MAGTRFLINLPDYLRSNWKGLRNYAAEKRHGRNHTDCPSSGFTKSLKKSAGYSLLRSRLNFGSNT